ncbi:lipase 1-like isoform X2 [Homalodisca vitripennis]|nr:lipase 1-like isoform X2 [Homalodisca vitripennis]
MYLQTYTLTVALLVLLSHCSLGDDDDIEGPLMPVKADGGMYTTEEIIKERKHTGESHTVETEDGYKLTMFRVVQAKKPAIPVLFQHGYQASSDAWVTDPESLAFRLSDAGYDVWMTNARGNAYSRSHAKLKPEDKEFWDFSWHEMGMIDLPAAIDYVLNNTGQPSLHLIAHSMGTTVCFVMASSRPEYNQKLKSLVGLAPVAFLSKMVQMVGPEGMVEEMANKYMKQWKDSGKVELFPRKDLATDDKSQITCLDVEESYRDMCVDKIEEIQKVIGGAYIPAGTSLKTMEHFYQMSVTGIMKHYKFDSAEDNKKAYGSEEPPPYTDNFKKITAPTLLWSSDVDQIVMTKDVDDLVALLPNLVADNRLQDIDCFDHIAFLFPRQKSCIAERAKFYSSVLDAIQKLDKK